MSAHPHDSLATGDCLQCEYEDGDVVTAAKFSSGERIVDWEHGSVPAEVLREVKPDRSGRRYSIRRDGGHIATVKEGSLRHEGESVEECLGGRCHFRVAVTAGVADPFTWTGAAHDIPDALRTAAWVRAEAERREVRLSVVLTEAVEAYRAMPVMDRSKNTTEGVRR